MPRDRIELDSQNASRRYRRRWRRCLRDARSRQQRRRCGRARMTLAHGDLHRQRPAQRSTSSRARALPTRCAASSISPGRISAASTASAAPARCCSMASRARLPDARGPGRRRRDHHDRGYLAGRRLDALQDSLRGITPCNAASARPAWCWPLHHCSSSTRRRGEAEIREAISGNLCRCTGYQPIVAAAVAIASNQPGKSRTAMRRSA